MGFLDYLSPGLTAASTAVTGYQNAKADESRQQMLDAIAARKQQQADAEMAVRMQLQQAQIDNLGADNDRAAEKDRRDFMAKGGIPGGASIAVDTPAAAAPPSLHDQLTDPRALTVGTESKSALMQPVDIGSIPKTHIVETPDTMDPTQTGAYQRAALGVNGRAETTAATNAVRVRIAKKANDTKVAIAGMPARARAATDDGAKKQSWTASRARELTKADLANGKLGMPMSQAADQARREADQVFGGGASAPAAAAAPPVPSIFNKAMGRDPGGDITLGAENPFAGAKPPVADQPSPNVIAAVKAIAAGHGTLAQLQASNNSEAFKAAVKKALGQP